MMSCVPRWNPALQLKELDTGEIVVVYERSGNWPLRLLYRLFAVPSLVELMLDPVGSKVVRHMDGVRTVADLMAFVAREFKLSRKEAEVAILKYVDMLARRGLIGLEVRSMSEER